MQLGVSCVAITFLNSGHGRNYGVMFFKEKNESHIHFLFFKQFSGRIICRGQRIYERVSGMWKIVQRIGTEWIIQVGALKVKIMLATLFGFLQNMGFRMTKFIRNHREMASRYNKKG